ncbi:N-formylglutamate amidohydrolase [Sphingomonas oleivorans]|uniref:N-formylglutamate amidohydrolase n=1 Tax=Sphingomonas oleivorans TaxID=1735121 RepID=A0A2T5G008_9SPHN|nr:N-formylglutamate amidohydrolase [Sphingomonas oleivorans]PTQ12292.1 N-formylglutamate amidohydrolase [Sphingomonas oleivorans]
MQDDPIPSHAQLGPDHAATPLVIAVPHAGRDYPAELLAASRLPRSRLEALEDRFADRLIAGAVGLGAIALVARRARAWIDLNRDPREIDPGMVAAGHSLPAIATARMRGGLGLLPRRIAGAGEIMNRRLAEAEVRQRIEQDHAPYHQAIASALAEAHARHGVALLIDCHSMPSLVPAGGTGAARIVLGDLHGRSAHSSFMERAEAVVRANGLPLARNSPYAGGHTLDRHGAPKRNIHAIQIEVDRSLYLMEDLRTPSQAGINRMAEMVTEIARALIDEASARPALAAE